MTKIVLLILASTTFTGIGQVFFKKAVKPLETPNLRQAGSYGTFLRGVLTSPLIWLGFLTIGSGIVVWLIALAQTELSVAFPIGSLQYLVILVTARIFLGERIDRMKLMGTMLVIAGICLISAS